MEEGVLTAVDDPSLLLTVREAARASHIPERSLRAAIASGQLKALRWSRRRTYVYLTDVTAWRLRT